MGSVRDEISKNLLYYRKKSGLTQKQLAEQLGVKNTAVSNWESGTNSIDIETLVNVCKIFDVSINEMYGMYSHESSRNSEIPDSIKPDVDLLCKLDSEDRAEIRGMMKQMLKSEKYNRPQAKNA